MESKLSIVRNDGSSAGEFSLDPGWLEMTKGNQALHDTVVAFLAKLRSGSASTKNRSEVRGTGSKPHRQKGTGRARAGTRQSPIWRGGGVTFGPKPRAFSKAVNGKVRRLALKRAFSERVEDGAVVVIEEINFDSPKTKNMTQLMQSLQLGDNALVVVDEVNENLFLASRNLPNLEVMKATAVNPYWLLLFKKIIFSKAGLDAFVSRLESNERKVQE